MAKRKKQITMSVTVSVPGWMTAAQARKEVRSLIKYRAFAGHFDLNSWDQADETNFKVVRVAPAVRP